MVEDCDTWVPTMDSFIKWYEGHNLNTENSTFVTCGNWDLASCLPGQCAFSQEDIPLVLDVGWSGQFVNLKSSYQQFTGKYGKVRDNSFYVCGDRFIKFYEGTN